MGCHIKLIDYCLGCRKGIPSVSNLCISFGELFRLQRLHRTEPTEVERFYILYILHLCCIACRCILQSCLLHGSANCRAVGLVLIWIQSGVKMTLYLLHDW